LKIKACVLAADFKSGMDVERCNNLKTDVHQMVLYSIMWIEAYRKVPL